MKWFEKWKSELLIYQHYAHVVAAQQYVLEVYVHVVAVVLVQSLSVVVAGQ